MIIEQRHTDKAIAVARDTGWQIDTFADDAEWAGVGIGPVGQHRDSDALDRSNFEVVTEDLRERYPDDFDIVSFSHWAVGWVEEIVWNVANADLRAAVDIWRERLADYPVASDDHFSELETTELMDYLADEIQRCEIPAGVTTDAVISALMETGDIGTVDDVTDNAIQHAIDHAADQARIAAATPPEAQLQIVQDLGRPHTDAGDLA